MSEESIRELASQVALLRNELASKLAADSVTELKASVAAIGEKLPLLERISKLEPEVTALTEQLKLSKRIAKVEALVKYLSFTAAGVTVIIGVLGWLGVKSFDSIIHTEVDRRFSFYSDLSSGLAYHDKFPASAIPYLLRCFDERPFEEPIVAALLFASDEADSWDVGQKVLDRLERDPIKSSNFRDPITYNLIGVAALNVGLSVPDYRPYAQRAFDQGLRIATPDNSNALWFLHFNRWRLLFSNGDSGANEEIAYLKNLKPPPDVQSWEQARNWKWFRVLLGSKPTLAVVAEQSYRSILKSGASQSSTTPSTGRANAK